MSPVFILQREQDSYDVNILVKDFTDIRELKLIIKYNLENLELLEIVKNPSILGKIISTLTVPVTATEYQTYPGSVVLSWFYTKPVSLKEDEILVTLKFKNLKDGNSKIEFDNSQIYNCRTFGNETIEYPGVPPNTMLRELTDTPYEQYYINGKIEFNNINLKTNTTMAQNLYFTYEATERLPLKIGTKFNIPIKVSTPLTVTAISLIMSYLSDHIKINKVGLLNEYGNLDTTLQNFMWATPILNQIRIGWFASSPEGKMVLTTNDTLLILEAEVIKDFAEDQQFILLVTEDQENELAGKDPSYVPDPNEPVDPYAIPEDPNMPMNPIKNVALKVNIYQNASEMEIPKLPEFPPKAKVAVRKEIIGYIPKQVITNKCTNCSNYDEKCTLGNFAVAKGGICDYYL